MQNFYKVTQGNNEKVPSFTARLEGTLNQIQLKCLRRIVDWEVACHIKDWLFHGVCKHIRDSIRYLHSNPETTYSQLMVAARKAERETEDAKEKVRVRSSTATEVTDGSKELGDQIDRLMATLNRAEQGTYPATTPNSPRHRGHGRGWMDRNTPACPNSHNGWTGQGQNTSICSSSVASRLATAFQSRKSTQALTGAQGNAQMQKPPVLSNALDARAWAICLGSVQLWQSH